MKSVFNLLFAFFLISSASAQDAISVKVYGEGTPVLLLPGFASDGRVWKATVNSFKDTKELHVVDYAGFGRLAPIDGPWLETVLAELTSYVAQLNHPDLVIIGHSMGGTMATWLAAQRELNIKEIVVVDGLPATGALMFPNFKPEELSYDSDYNRQLLALDEYSFTQMAVGMAAGMASSRKDQKIIQENMTSCDRKTYVYGYTDYLKWDVRPILSDIKIPVHILAAGLPYGVETATQTFREQYANLKEYSFHINDHSKHFLMMDDFEWFDSQIATILE